MTGKEGYVVSCNEDETVWYVVRRFKRSGILKREILPGRYSHESDATEAMIQLIESER